MCLNLASCVFLLQICLIDRHKRTQRARKKSDGSAGLMSCELKSLGSNGEMVSISMWLSGIRTGWLNVLLTRLSISATSARLFLVKHGGMIRKASRYGSFCSKQASLSVQMGFSFQLHLKLFFILFFFIASALLIVGKSLWAAGCRKSVSIITV